MTVFLFALLYLFHLIADVQSKLPSTPMPCSAEVVSKTIRCRQVEATKLQQIAPTNWHTVVSRTFLSQLLHICNSVERLFQCTASYLNATCEFPVNLPGYSEADHVVGAIQLCHDTQVYDKYAILVNCIKANYQEFTYCRPMNTSSAKNHGCRNLRRPNKCIVDFTVRNCQDTSSMVQLVRYLSATMVHTPSTMCAYARRGISPGSTETLNRDGLMRPFLRNVSNSNSFGFQTALLSFLFEFPLSLIIIVFVRM
ncbi:hypothetical protein EG68_06762 [Paragonimus skrjabini miyazakii]|uniref:Uncharacterized protein n=1 Tax=Paragonimus skrjabini miyazakii TaxID=59628 RepID=A0A8S9YN58_9TREM|nr:hypothetical protein EG68_06762 [Paragonimus skrjabini miyazakii]